MTRMDYLRAEGYSDSEAVVIAFNECCLTPKPEELLRWPGWVGEFFRNLAVDELLSASNQDTKPKEAP